VRAARSTRTAETDYDPDRRCASTCFAILIAGSDACADSEWSSADVTAGRRAPPTSAGQRPSGSGRSIGIFRGTLFYLGFRLFKARFVSLARVCGAGGRWDACLGLRRVVLIWSVDGWTQYRVSRGTVRRALAELANAGLVTPEPGRGTFVRNTPCSTTGQHGPSVRTGSRPRRPTPK
jgi:Bacterial regulatory proteins, gntR family